MAMEIPARGGRWLRAAGYGLLAELSTIVTIVLIVVLYRVAVSPGLPDAEYAAFGERVGGIVGLIAGTLFTFLFARLLMPRLSSRFVEHGLVVAVVAIALSVGGSIAGHKSVPAAYVIASAFKFGAGALAGALYSRSPGATRPGA